MIPPPLWSSSLRSDAKDVAVVVIPTLSIQKRVESTVEKEKGRKVAQQIYNNKNNSSHIFNNNSLNNNNIHNNNNNNNNLQKFYTNQI